MIMTTTSTTSKQERDIVGYEMENKMGAGVILMAFKNDQPYLLGLIGDKKHRKKHGAVYDLPKGTADPGERQIDCAIRETFEETGINIHPGELIAGPHRTSFLHMWIAEIDINERIVIERNPESGKFEHEGYDWLTEEQAMAGVYPYLRPFVKWAFSHI